MKKATARCGYCRKLVKPKLSLPVCANCPIRGKEEK